MSPWNKSQHLSVDIVLSSIVSEMWQNNGQKLLTFTTSCILGTAVEGNPY